MDQLLFAVLFIAQFVGHRVGDYLFQTDTQAVNKTRSTMYLTRHCFVYAATIGMFSLIVLPTEFAFILAVLTFIEHFLVDTRKPVFAWKKFLEFAIARNRGYSPDNLPMFVLIEIDQSIHYLRIFLLSLLFSYIM